MFGVSFAHGHIVVIWSVVVLLEGDRVRRNEAHVESPNLAFRTDSLDRCHHRGRGTAVVQRYRRERDEPKMASRIRFFALGAAIAIAAILYMPVTYYLVRAAVGEPSPFWRLRSGS